MQELLDLAEARVDADDDRGPLLQEVVAKPAAPVHLDEQAAEIAQRVLARFQQRPALAPEHAGVGTARRDTGSSLGAAAEHPAECRCLFGYSWMTTRRSSVISRTAQAGPSRVLPESFTPPYGIWSAR